MIFLPIVGRELRVAARRRGVVFARLAAATLAVLAGGWRLWFAGDWPTTASLGATMFYTLVSLAFVLCLTAGPLFTADAISEEKREGTLGLLFLTDLRGYDVVLGKFTAHSITALSCLVAILPVLAIPILIGGVSLQSFVQAALALGNALFFSLAVGILVSSFCIHPRTAFAVTIFVLFLLAGFLPWLTSSFGVVFSPSFPVSLVLGQGHRGDFWLSLLLTHLMGWGFLAWASHVVPLLWHEQPAATGVARWRERIHEWSFGAPRERQAMRARLLDRNPVLWLGSRNRLKTSILWWFIGVTLVVWLACCLVLARDSWSWGLTLIVAAFFQIMLKWLMASEATTRWVEDHQSGAVELLLTTSMSAEEILHGHMLALRRMFGLPALALGVVELASLAAGARISRFERDAGILALTFLIVFFSDLRTLAWVGTWQSMLRRRANRAFLHALLRVLVLPWFIFGLFIFLGAPSEGGTVAFVFFLICGITNVVLYKTSRDGLRNGFRLAAAEQYQTGRS